MNKLGCQQIAAKLRHLRRTHPRAPLSSQDLAIQLGVPTPTIGQWEASGRGLRFADLEKLARLFGVRMISLLPELPDERVRLKALNPDATGLSQKQLGAVLGYMRGASAPLPAENAAIVCLTRGYQTLGGYDALIERNRAIYQVINSRRERHYPLMIWHEGNIPPEHQSYIAAADLNHDIRFVDVSPVFRMPTEVKEDELVEYWPVGYRLMCRFHSYNIWQYAAEFEYVMRVDEDCILKSAAFDPLDSLFRAGGDFAAADFVEESHELTNRTLAPFARELAASMCPEVPEESVYNHAFPYTNVYVARTAFWRQPVVRRFLELVTQNPDFVRFRWGDCPVLGIALTLFAAPEAVYRMSQLGYVHGSHNWNIEPMH